MDKPSELTRSCRAIAQSSLERLATECLSPAMTAAFIIANNDPEKVDWARVGKIAVRVAITIREEVDQHIDRSMIRDDADAYIARLAVSIAKEGQDGR